MRAIQMTEFGGPEVLKLTELAQPQPAVERGAHQGHPRGTELRRHAYAHELLCAARRRFRSFPAARWRASARTPASGWSRSSATAATPSTPPRPSELVFPIPAELDDGTALAIIVQGLTAWHLYRTAGRVQQGESVVVHAAAGGVGSLAVQLGHPLGAGRVIATASSDDKRALALELGADVAIDSVAEGLTDRLIEANGGQPVDVVFEMAGGEVFDASYEALAPFGRIVVCGIASQQPNQVSTGSLLRHSRAVVGFYLFHCLERPGDVHRCPVRAVRARGAGRAERGRGAHLPARAGRSGAHRPSRAAHHRQAPARSLRVKAA